MTRVARRPDAWLVVLGAICLAAWSVLALYGSDLMLPAFCSTATPWAMPLSAALGLALALNAPAKLVMGWALMVAAMMAPAVIAPLRHVRDRSFAKRRTPAMLLFASGYGAAWMIAGLGLQFVALAARLTSPTPLVCFSLALATALVWQASPAKQWCLNRCHRRPQLAAFGAAADRDAFGFGLSNGLSCVGVCWALMLLPFFVGQGHILAMIAVALFVFAERFEDPAPLVWRRRGFGKALRIVSAQARLQVAAWRYAAAA